MKTILIVLLFTFLIINPVQSQIFDKLKKNAEKLINLDTKNTPYTSEEAAKAIKEALINGTSKGTDLISKADGFYKNPDIKIAFPPEAKTVESSLRGIGMGAQVDKAVLSLNRAAEDASKSAKNIFVGAINKMTVDDAIKIVKGDSTSATKYLKDKTTKELTTAFSPIIQKSLDKVDATKFWKDVMTHYNKIPFVEKINPDLKQYVTQKALDALFLMIAREEASIRKDPIARTTELLKKVFGR
jgi:hypothetical protein